MTELRPTNQPGSNHQPPATQLNDSQKLHLRVGCQYMDRLLQDMEGILTSAQSKSPFPQYRIDLSPAQGRVLDDYIRRFRAQLIQTLAWQQIAPSVSDVPATRAISTRLHFIDNAIADLRPKAMRDSGLLSDEAAEELNGVVHELGSLIENMMNYVQQELATSLQDRIGKLATVGQELALLRRIEEVVTRRGLVEFRPRIDGLVSRLEDKTYEVALFGRVSSGKSSFLNALLGTEVLPVGVNPITAVLTRMRYGEEINAFLRYGNRELVRVSLDDFRAFIAETGNPGNRRTLTRALLEFPSPRLSEGIVLVDTPGLGSLAQRGASETIAYLPSCDLALLLVDAGSTLTAEDVGTLRLILEAGVPALVLLSKSDLLKPEDTESTKHYIQEQIERELHVSLPVHAVSTTDDHRALVDQFFQSELEPRFRRAAELKIESVMSKLARLRQDVVASLQTKIARMSHPTPDHGEHAEEVEGLLRAVTGAIGELWPKLDRQIMQLRGAGPGLLNRLSDEIAIELSLRGSATVSSSKISQHLHDAMNREVEPLIQIIRSTVTRAVDDTRQAGTKLLRADLPPQAGMDHLIREIPRFEIALAPEDLRLGFWKSLVHSRLRKKLKQRLDAPLKIELEEYAAALSQWAQWLTREIQFEINSYVDVYRATLQEANSSDTAQIGPSELVEDVERLTASPVKTVSAGNHVQKRG